MEDRKYRLSVGMLVLSAVAVAIWLTFHFGHVQSYFEKKYQVVVHFDTAPGLRLGIPVRLSGITIGRVTDVRIDDKNGGVLVRMDINETQKLPTDSVPQLSRSLLGDTAIEVLPGQQTTHLAQGDLLKGESPADPMDIMYKLEKNVSRTLDSFAETSRQWKVVGDNVNLLLTSKQGQMDEVIARASESFEVLSQTLRTVNTTLQSVNQIVNDPQMQLNLKNAVASVPKLIQETEQTLIVARNAVTSVHRSMENIQIATEPLAIYSKPILEKVDLNLRKIDSILNDVKVTSKLLATEDGTLQRLAKDPELYQYLTRSAALFSVLMQNIDPIIKDFRLFSDRVARHPELLGVSGALKGSTGIKDSDVTPVSGTHNYAPNSGPTITQPIYRPSQK
jgi:phospholipid/cholesterol/gamma-HCH transport system substrate-binding protein